MLVSTDSVFTSTSQMSDKNKKKEKQTFHPIQNTDTNTFLAAIEPVGCQPLSTTNFVQVLQRLPLLSHTIDRHKLLWWTIFPWCHFHCLYSKIRNEVGEMP
jgi:hypothetical protein